MTNKKIELYSYNGFSKPEKINVNDLIIESNYLGDMTEDFLEDYNQTIKHESLEDMQENQFLFDYGIWINPTLKQLQTFNKSKMLSKNDYLENFKGHNQLFKNRR